MMRKDEILPPPRPASNGMRLLICTQAVDTEDIYLGFFHLWASEFAKHFDHIHLVCLKEGKHALPRNISVHSLGKESARGSRALKRFFYWIRLYRYAWRYRREYDVVFVHMNQEYVLLGAWLWMLLRKPIYLWRNHYSGTILTDVVALLCQSVFCTSKFSYTAKYKKTIRMPVGVDTATFKPSVTPRPHSILSLGRIASSKNVHVVLAALKILRDTGVPYTASIYGDALPKDTAYLEEQKRFVRENDLSGRVTFHAGIKNSETPSVYSAHEIFINASPSGMYDKTIFEAAACGSFVLAASKDFAEHLDERFVFPAYDAAALAERLKDLLNLSETDKERARSAFRQYVAANSLETLGVKLAEEMSHRAA